MAGLPPASDLLVVLTPERPELLIADLDLIVYGRVFATKRAPRSPLEGFDVRADDRATWKVGMIHGSRFIAGKVERDDVLFSDDEIAASGLDYLALGHWHSFLSGRAGATTWAYAGAPEPVAVDQDGAGDVCLVRLEDGIGGRSSVHLERVRVGRTDVPEHRVDAAELASQDDLVRRLAELADPDLVLAVTVVGIASRQPGDRCPTRCERALAAVVPAPARSWTAVPRSWPPVRSCRLTPWPGASWRTRRRASRPRRRALTRSRPNWPARCCGLGAACSSTTLTT